MGSIHFILTGGTINKAYNPVTEKPEMSDTPIVPDYLKKIIQPHCDLSFETICLKDSLDLTDSDRAAILKAAQNSSADHIVIIHGTSTMSVTGEYLHKNMNGEKTVVLTGAMIPLREFAMSDGGFNLGFALAEVQHLPPGVYICMNGKSFKTGAVRKNKEIGRFEES